MTKFTFANKNIIIVEGYKPGDAIPSKVPTLKRAAIIAVEEINKGITSDSRVLGVIDKGDLKDITFENGAVLTLPADYNVAGYKHALEIVISEIAD